MKKLLIAFVATALAGCGFNFDLEGHCFEGETHEMNPLCPEEAAPDGSDGPDGLDVTDGTDGTDGTDATDEVEGTDGLDTIVDGSDSVDSIDATDATDGTEGSDATDGTEPTDSEDGTDPVDVTDSTDATDTTDSTDATDVTDGSDGSDATDSTNTTDTTDATDATDGSDSTDGTEPPACVVDKDCAPDNNPCTDTRCDPSGECIHPPNTESCDDGNACTNGDVCSAGTCTGVAIACDDQNSCTTDSCVPANGCVFTPNTDACNDGNPCTENDACNAGVCAAGANMCTCTFDADCTTYEDGNLCNGTLRCELIGGVGNCVTDTSSVVACNTADNTTCLVATCEPATGSCTLQPVNNTKSCPDDGDACTVLETCTEGVCAGITRQCDDNDLCTGSESCDPASGCVAGAPLACDDGDACNGLETCITLLGGCVPGESKNCNDNYPCTNDSCAASSGECMHTPDNLQCNDQDPCTLDACIPGLGCYNQGSEQLLGVACNDGNACTITDACNADGQCLGTEPVVCAVPDQCHDQGVCDPTTGKCSNPTVVDNTVCDDGLGCTTDDVCSVGQCQGQPVICEVDSCHLDAVCTEFNGQGVCKQGTERCLPDADACTYDECDLLVGCYTINVGREVNTIGGCGILKGDLDGDNCPGKDADLDNDGVCDYFAGGDCAGGCPPGVVDNAPYFANPGQADTDGDGIGDVFDPDADGDGVCDPTWPAAPYGSCGEAPPP